MRLPAREVAPWTVVVPLKVFEGLVMPMVPGVTFEPTGVLVTIRLPAPLIRPWTFIGLVAVLSSQVVRVKVGEPEPKVMPPVRL